MLKHTDTATAVQNVAFGCYPVDTVHHMKFSSENANITNAHIQARPFSFWIDGDQEPGFAYYEMSLPGKISITAETHESGDPHLEPEVFITRNEGARRIQIFTVQQLDNLIRLFL